MSKYKICPKCGADVISKDKRFVPVKTANNADLQKIPFRCAICGGIYINLKPTLDRVIVWPDSVPDTYIQNGTIEVPVQFKEEHVPDTGTVLAFGKGYYDSKRFNPTAGLYVGARVIYDKTVPWDISAEGSDGKIHSMKIMGCLDVKVVLEE